MVNRGRNRTFTEKHKQRISEAAKKRFEDPEQRQLSSDNHWSKGPNAAISKAKMVASLTGRKLTEEHRVNISKGGKGKKRTAEQKEHYFEGYWSKLSNAEEIKARVKATRKENEAKRELERLQALLDQPSGERTLFD